MEDFFPKTIVSEHILEALSASQSESARMPRHKRIKAKILVCLFWLVCLGGIVIVRCRITQTSIISLIQFYT